MGNQKINIPTALAFFSFVTLSMLIFFPLWYLNLLIIYSQNVSNIKQAQKSTKYKVLGFHKSNWFQSAFSFSSVLLLRSHNIYDIILICNIEITLFISEDTLNLYLEYIHIFLIFFNLLLNWFTCSDRQRFKVCVTF